MLVEVVKSKIHRVTVTQADLNYIGSITIDEDLMDAANIIANEKVYIVNNNNGERFSTYVIKGERGSGMVCLNGPGCRSCRSRAAGRAGGTPRGPAPASTWISLISASIIPHGTTEFHLSFSGRSRYTNDRNEKADMRCFHGCILRSRPAATAPAASVPGRRGPRPL